MFRWKDKDWTSGERKGTSAPYRDVAADDDDQKQRLRISGAIVSIRVNVFSPVSVEVLRFHAPCCVFNKFNETNTYIFK